MNTEAIEQAIRDFPLWSGRPGHAYGFDDLDYEDFVREFAAYLGEKLEESTQWQATAGKSVAPGDAGS